MFTFPQSLCPPPYVYFSNKDYLFYEPLHQDDIRWNFEKFLVDRAGRPRFRYHPNTDPLAIREHIRQLLEEKEEGEEEEEEGEEEVMEKGHPKQLKEEDEEEEKEPQAEQF